MWKNLFKQIRIQVSLSKLDFSDILEFFVVLGWGSKGGEAPNLKKNILMFFLKNFRERKADSDQNVLREVSVFLGKFEESGRKLKKNIEIQFWQRNLDSDLLE